MLDIFLDAAAEQEKNASAVDELTEVMKELPLEELQKIASGKTKLSFYDSNPKWLKQFEGTPLYEQAIQLEQACIAIEASDIEKRMTERNERDDIWDQKDMLRLKKKQLELQLAHAKLSGEAPEEEVEEEEEEEGETTVEASARFVHSIVHGFPKQAAPTDAETRKANMGNLVGNMGAVGAGIKAVTGIGSQPKAKPSPPAGVSAPASAAMKKAAHAIRLHPKA